jgi:hypothetical protein
LLQPSHDTQISTSSSCSIRRIAFVSAPRNPLPEQYLPESVVLGLRGGDDDAATDDGDDDDDESDQGVSEEEEAEAEEDKAAPPAKGDLDASLSASAVQSAIKSKVKRESAKKQAAKLAMSEELKSSPVDSSSKKIKKKPSSVSLFRVPYVIRAFLNPATVFKMTVAYWASLFDLDYLSLKEAPAQDLLLALQEKARYEPSKKVLAATRSK